MRDIRKSSKAKFSFNKPISPMIKINNFHLVGVELNSWSWGGWFGSRVVEKCNRYKNNFAVFNFKTKYAN